MTDDGGTYSEGAVRFERGQCLRCLRSTWSDADPIAACGVARSAGEQRTAPSPILPPDLEGHRGTVSARDTIIYSLKRKEFVALDTMIDASWATRERLKDGQWVAAILFDGYAWMLARAQQWDDQLGLIRSWRAQQPKSGAAALVEAQYWIAYAQLALGGKGETPPRARLLADERAAAARSVLERSKTYASRNPLWYSEMLAVATLQGWPQQKRMAVFDEAVKREPAFWPTYVAMATSFAPRFGGSLDGYHAFVDVAVEHSRKTDGDALYARLYWNLAELERDRDPFRALGIPWSQMKSGFMSLDERYPHSVWMLHNFASFACRAGDGRTFASLLPRLTATDVSSMRAAWVGAFTFEYCRGLYTKTT